MLFHMLSILNARLGQIEREEGQDMAEYGLLLALIAVVVVVALVTLGPVIQGVFTDIEGSF
jgi:pilus assembly protein Flp/PilA